MWWMTGIAEKCNLDRSPHVNQAILLLAFADWMRGRKEKEVRLVTDDLSLVHCLGGWGQAHGITCVREKARLPGLRKESLGVSGFQYFRPLRALFFLARRVWGRKALRGVGLPEWRSSRGSLTFVTYLFNHARSGKQEGFLESPYWGELPKVLQKKGIHTNWLHLYVEDARLPKAKDAAQLLGLFNKHGSGIQIHATLDSFISGAVLWKTLRDWWRLQRASRGVSCEACFPKIEGFDVWPLFRAEWRESLSGPPAISNLLSLNLFESALQSLPRQKLGVYLQENLGWETAMLTSWRQGGHGSVIGFPHSAVRFWDLRYFHDADEWKDGDANARPCPDRIAVHGPVARKSLRKGGFSPARFVEVEALRHPLQNQRPTPRKKKGGRGRSAGPRILILGDYAEAHTRNQMGLLHEIAGRIPPNAVLVARPHPACPIRPQDYPNLSFSISSQTLDRLLAWADLVYASPTTSAALDALSCGVPVVIPIGEHGLNLSPLKGLCEKSFVSGPEQLAQAFATIAARKNRPFRPPQLFRLDPRLPRWMKLIEQHSSAKRASEH